MKNPFRKNTKPYLFYELAQPDKNGFSREVKVTEFVGKYKDLKFGNGGDWPRTDGPIGNKFNIDRIKEKGKIVSIKLFGNNTKAKILKKIRKDISEIIYTRRCVVLDISKVEVDHKDGHRDDYNNFKLENQSLDQFQPLSKAVNNAKKEHCKKCRETKTRFDAKKLGYKVSVWAGDNKYRNSCFGCYWFDIKKFNEEISKSFEQ